MKYAKEWIAVVKTWKVETSETGTVNCLPLHSLNGQSNLNQISQKLPAGAYTTFRTFGKGKVLHLEEHFNRLEETARLSQSSIRINRESLRSALRTAVGDMPDEDHYRIRITLDLVLHPGEIFISIEPLTTPSDAMYLNGVNVVTRHFQRQNPRAKLTSFIKKAEEMRSEVPDGINEIMMVDDEGRILEGISSNVFLVKDGVVWTAEEGVLHGLTRSMVLEEINRLAIPINLQGFPISDLSQAEEVFITSASRAILPVRKIDDLLIKDPVPGKITQQLTIRYQERIDRVLERF